MRNVTRTSKPASLRRNDSRWKTELLEAVRSGDQQLIKRRKHRCKNPDVRSALDAMYRNRCCYCESQVGAVRADQIEHRMPVEPFREQAFEWDNLHLACSGCNRAKSDKWNPTHPILDAVTDVPITEHLDYDSRVTGVRRVGLTPRGQTTVSHAGLNRDKLREARTITMSHVLGLVMQIRQRLALNLEDPLAASRREELEEMCDGPYGSMIRWAITNLLRAT